MRISDWSSDVCSSDLPSTFVINWCHRSAVVQKLTPVFVNGVESPNPGMEGTITSNASAGSPPNDAGSASGRITRFRSQKVQGQPCDRMMRSEEHTSDSSPNAHLVCRLLPEKKQTQQNQTRKR